MAVEEHRDTFLIMEAAYIGKFFHKEDKRDLLAVDNYFHANPKNSM
jgi:hypothetical protein